jgi:DNA processing protein
VHATDKTTLSDEERLDWLRLIRSDNVGPHTFHALVKRYGSVRTALNALPDLASRGGAARRTQVCSRAQAERELARTNALGIELLGIGEPNYPGRLRLIEDAPPLLAVRGKLDILRQPAVAMVGARNASAAGMRFAERPACGLPSGWRTSSRTRDWPLCQGSPAASMRLPIGQPCPPARWRSSPEER